MVHSRVFLLLLESIHTAVSRRNFWHGWPIVAEPVGLVVSSFALFFRVLFPALLPPHAVCGTIRDSRNVLICQEPVVAERRLDLRLEMIRHCCGFRFLWVCVRGERPSREVCSSNRMNWLRGRGGGFRTSGSTAVHVGRKRPLLFESRSARHDVLYGIASLLPGEDKQRWYLSVIDLYRFSSPSFKMYPDPGAARMRFQDESIFCALLNPSERFRTWRACVTLWQSCASRP